MQLCFFNSMARWQILWDAGHPLTIGQDYTFTAEMHVENNTGLPMVRKPAVQITPGIQYMFHQETGTKAVAFDTVLNGNVDFELGESVQWANRKPGEGFELYYPEFVTTDSTPPRSRDCRVLARSGLPITNWSRWRLSGRLIPAGPVWLLWLLQALRTNRTTGSGTGTRRTTS